MKGGSQTNRRIEEINEFLESIPHGTFEVFGLRSHGLGDAKIGQILPLSVHPAEWLREIGIEAEEDEVLSGTAAFEVGLDREGLRYDASPAYRSVKRLARYSGGRRQILVLGGDRTEDTLPEADEYGITIAHAEVLAILTEVAGVER
jgi:hypothetical protein